MSSFTSLYAMHLWLDSSSFCPSSSDRVNDADAVLVPEDDPTSVLPSPSSKPKFMIRDDSLLVHDGNVVGTIVDIDNAEGQDTALAAVGSVEWILVSCHGDWRMIPAENLISAARGAGTRLAFVVDNNEHVVGLSRALELRVDALCVAANASDGLWNAACKARTEREADEQQTAPDKLTPQIVTGSCWRVPSKAVLADRVCVDLVRSLSPEEGCWMGSSAKAMALVLSEAASSSFVPSRPFRVNAGPVHSYIVLGDGVTTKYLCELQAGDEVLVYNAKTGDTRSVAVGRLKIEVRPCLIVELRQPPRNNEPELNKSQVFLQQAETVRLGKEDGSFVRVTDLSDNEQHDPTSGEKQSGEPILLRVISAGTHLGKTYTGKVFER